MTPYTSRIGMYKYQIIEEIEEPKLYDARRHINDLIKYIEEM